MAMIDYLVSRRPDLGLKMKVAHERGTPKEHVKRIVQTAFLYSVFFVFFLFLAISKNRDLTTISKFLILIVGFGVFLIAFYNFLSLNLEAKIKKVEREINKEVLYAGRFLLIKLESGTPFFNALIDGTEAHGTARIAFKEIVDDINFGTPIEDALLQAMKMTPSKRFKKILFVVNNSLRLGIDIAPPLTSTLKDLVSEQIMEIEAYSKKLNSLAMFYMIIAIVVPSLGLTVLVIVISFMSISLGLSGYALLIGFIALSQLLFLSIFKNIRPAVSF
jgi:pilus assembly protein TadC